jgi:uncharacterized membrane protein YeiB
MTQMTDERAAGDVTRSAPGREKPRIIGIDVARGLALAGMLAVHVFPTFDSDGSASIATAYTSGRGAAIFATMAGVGLAIVTGRQRPVSGGARVTASVGLAIRALLLLVIGLVMGYVTIAGDLDVYVILPYYAAMFLLAIPLLGLRPQVLAIISVSLAAVTAFAIFTTVGDVANPSRGIDPTIGDFVRHPVGMLVLLLFGGAYPAVLWLAYICAGMAMGRLDLSSKRVAGWLFGGGAALAAVSWLASSLLLFWFGGLRHLRDNAPAGTQWTDSRLVWEPWGDFDTFWWYAGRAPHSGTPFDMLHTIGFAVAVLGAALLVTRLPLAARLLRPVATAGSMVLTLYCAHIVFLATGLLGDHYYAKYCVLLAAMIIFAVLWKRIHPRGPLEELVSRISTLPGRRARDRSRHGTAAPGGEPSAEAGRTTPPPAALTSKSPTPMPSTSDAAPGRHRSAGHRRS